MRTLFFLSFLFFSAIADVSAAQWTQVTPNHGNLLYSVGETAIFRLKNLVTPINENYRLKVTVEHIGQGPETEVSIPGQHGIYQTVPLFEGVESFRIRTKLIGPDVPPEAPFEKVVEDRIWNLTVVD